MHFPYVQYVKTIHRKNKYGISRQHIFFFDRILLSYIIKYGNIFMINNSSKMSLARCKMTNESIQLRYHGIFRKCQHAQHIYIE